MRIETLSRMNCGSKELLACLLLIGGVGSGCLGGKSPDVQYYTFEAMAQPPAASEEATSEDDIAVALGRVRLPSYLEHQQIVTRSEGSRLHYDEFHRWAGKLDAEMLRVLGEDLAILLESRRIVTYPSHALFEIDYQVQIEIDRFEALSSGAAELRARFSVQAGTGGPALVVDRLELREDLESESHADVARAHSILLSRLGERLAGHIRDLAAGDD